VSAVNSLRSGPSTGPADVPRLVIYLTTLNGISGAERVPMRATGAYVYYGGRGVEPAEQRVISVGTRRHRGTCDEDQLWSAPEGLNV
jgi:hypothetical protein